MNSLCKGFRQFALSSTSRNVKQLSGLSSIVQTNLLRQSNSYEILPVRSYAQGSDLSRLEPGYDSDWLRHNDVTYPPTKPGEPERPAECCYEQLNIKYNQLKMWYLCVMIRGMSIDEAYKQLAFRNRLGAELLTQILKEAQEEALMEHNFEHRSNMWIAEAFTRKGDRIKGIRKHAGTKTGIVQYKYINVYVKLREGTPPEHYYPPPQTSREMVEEYIQSLRSRRIVGSL